MVCGHLPLPPCKLAVFDFAGRREEAWPCWMGPKHQRRNSEGAATGPACKGARNARMAQIHREPQVTHI